MAFLAGATPWIYAKDILNKYTLATIVFPEFFWCTTFLGFKCPVEVGHIVKATVIGNFCYGLGGVNEHSADMAQSDFAQAINKSIASSFFNKAAE